MKDTARLGGVLCLRGLNATCAWKEEMYWTLARFEQWGYDTGLMAFKYSCIARPPELVMRWGIRCKFNPLYKGTIGPVPLVVCLT